MVKLTTEVMKLQEVEPSWERGGVQHLGFLAPLLPFHSASWVLLSPIPMFLLPCLPWFDGFYSWDHKQNKVFFWSKLLLSECFITVYYFALPCSDEIFFPEELDTERVYLAMFPSHSPSLREARAGTQGRNWGRSHRRMLLTGLISMACSTWFLNQPRINSPGGGTAHSGLASPTPIINQETVPTKLHPGYSAGGICSAEVLSSQVMQANLHQGDKKPTRAHSSKK